MAGAAPDLPEKVILKAVETREQSEQASAILYHRMRGSGREVFIRLGKHDLELTTPAGAEIAIWPYATITVVNQAADELFALHVPHDELHELRVPNLAWVEAITARSPELLKARQSARWERLLQIWSGVPDQGQAAIILGAIFLVIWSGYRASAWLADLW